MVILAADVIAIVTIFVAFAKVLTIVQDRAIRELVPIINRSVQIHTNCSCGIILEISNKNQEKK